MKEPIYDYDPAAALTDPETIAIFIADAVETEDTAHIAQALDVVDRAKGMTAQVKKSGLSRDSD